MKKSILLFILLVFTLTFASCGGGGGSTPPTADTGGNGQITDDGGGSGDQNEPDGSGVGHFDKIDGLIYYSNLKDKGTTSDGGKFTWGDGDEIVAFWLNDRYNVFLGYAPVRGNIAISELAINAQWISEETAGNIRTFLQALDVDADPSNGVTITEELRNRIREAIDFTLPRETFIRQYAAYAEYIAGDSGATGWIGQTDATFRLTLSKGTALYFPVDLLNTGAVSPGERRSSVLGTKKWIDDENTPKSGVYAVGLNPGTETLTIEKTGYTMIFHITVVAPSEFPDFSGTVVEFQTDRFTVRNHVPYQTYLNSVDSIPMIESLPYLNFILLPGEY